MGRTTDERAAREALVAADDRIRAALTRIGEAQQRRYGAEGVFYGGVPAAGVVAAAAKLAVELEAVAARLEAEECDRATLQREATARLAAFDLVKEGNRALIVRAKGGADEFLLLSKDATGKVQAHALDERYQGLADLVSRAELAFESLAAAATVAPTGEESR